MAFLFLLWVLIIYNSDNMVELKLSANDDNDDQKTLREDMRNQAYWSFVMIVVIPSALVLCFTFRYKIYSSDWQTAGAGLGLKNGWKWYQLYFCVAYDSMFTVNSVMTNCFSTVLAVASLVMPYHKPQFRAISLPLLLLYVFKLVGGSAGPPATKPASRRRNNRLSQHVPPTSISLPRMRR